MENKLIFFSFFLLTSIFAVSIVSAAEGDAAAQVSSFMTGVGNVVKAILGGLQPVVDVLLGKPDQVAVTQGTSSFLLVEILLLIIVFSLIFIVLDSFSFFSDHRWALFIVSIAASILSIRFLSDGWVNAILFPYQALGIALTAIIPFIIYFVFVEVKLKDPHGTPFLRRFLWIFFGVVFLFMYISRQAFTAAPNPPLFIWIYLVAALVAFAMAWFDGTIQKWMAKGKLTAAHARSNAAIIKHLTRELKQAETDFKNGVFGHGAAGVAAYKAEVARIKAEMAALT